jgi:hypothetical protein
MKKRIIILCSEDPAKQNAVDNYKPISCLPLTWTLLAGILVDGVNKLWNNSNILKAANASRQKYGRPKPEQT